MAAIFVLGGCGEAADDASGDRVTRDTDSPATRHGPAGLRIAIGRNISTIDPGLAEDTTTFEVIEQLFLALVDFDPQTLEVVPELASDWTTNEDGTVYRFSLRRDVEWTDGRAVTAHDVVWAVRRNLAPQTRAPYPQMLFIIKNARAVNADEMPAASLGVRAIGDYTVEFELEFPAAYFPSMLGHPQFRPLPRHVIEEHGASWTEPGHIVSNGSYRLLSWEKGDRLILEKSPGYAASAEVHIPRVQFITLPESGLGLQMYEQDDLDVIGGAFLPLPSAEIPRIKVDPALAPQYSVQRQPCTYYYGFNTRRSPVDEPLVRKAISAAIDRGLLIAVVVKGGEEAAFTFTPKPMFGAVDPSEGVGIRFDPERARAWLAEAGYPGGEGFPTLTLVHQATGPHAEIARGVQTLLEHHLNIRLETVVGDRAAYYERIAQPETPHLFQASWCADYPDANNWLYDTFHPGDADRWLGWDDAEFADVVEEAQRVGDEGERRRLYRRAEQLLTEEVAAVVPLYFMNAPYLVKPRIEGWFHMEMGGQHIRRWRFRER